VARGWRVGLLFGVSRWRVGLFGVSRWRVGLFGVSRWRVFDYPLRGPDVDLQTFISP